MTRFTVADFDRLGSRAGFRYRLPEYAGSTADMENLCVAQGYVREYEVRSGLKLVLSDVVAHHRYEATSVAMPQFSAVIMLQGKAHARLERHNGVSLMAQSGVSIACGDAVAMTWVHPAGQQLRGVNISLAAADGAGDEQLCDAVAKAMRMSGARLRRWSVQTHVLHTLQQLMDSPWQGAMHGLLLEGVSLQLLAHALADGVQAAPTAASPSARDRQLLERVRERLYSAPGEEHTLAELAKLACMSPSTLRVKFQAVYQRSVFGWLRERRLEVARDYLTQGWSVQQAAYFVGYRHATNFATAFRARYGIAPSELH